MNFFRTVLLILFLGITARAADEQRWLVVVDTSTAMKKRIPNTDAQIGNMLLDSIGGKLHAGDSLGVWFFDSTLRTGQFPLTIWQPSQAPEVVTNLIAFVRQQKYSGDTKFDALQPMLNRVIADSERLTILIFCDGADRIRWTPYDNGINNALAQTAAERKKSQQPVVVLLRTQMGKYVGATVNFPPSPLNFPPFPPLPRELKPVVTNPPAVVAPVKPPPPAPPAAPLIIVGTRVSADTNDIPKNTLLASNTAEAAVEPAVAPVAEKTYLTTNVAVVAVAPKPTNAPKPAVAHVTNAPKPAVLRATTNAAAAPVVAVAITNPAPVTNSVPAPAPADDSITKILTVAGVTFFVVAAVLIGFLAGRRRSPRGSLITSSMQDDFPPSKRK